MFSGGIDSHASFCEIVPKYAGFATMFIFQVGCQVIQAVLIASDQCQSVASCGTGNRNLPAQSTTDS
jgi:hypothetical protein